MATPTAWSPSRVRALNGLEGTQAAPRHHPERCLLRRQHGVACRASSTRAFFSFISISEAAPMCSTATPPASLARTLLQLLTIVVRRGVLDLATDLCHAGLNVLAGTGTPSTMVVLSLSMVMVRAVPQIFDRGILELQASIFADHVAAGQNGDVLEHGLATIGRSPEP